MTFTHRAPLSAATRRLSTLLGSLPCRALLVAGAFLSLAATPGAASAQGGSLRFGLNAPRQYEFADQRVLPPTFGKGEFTMELWIRPDTTFRVGPTLRSTIEQLENWVETDREPYTAGWWLGGNWLLDGFSRPDGFDGPNTRAGSFALQFYGGGRLRWLFADEDTMPASKVWGVGAYPAAQTASLLDGRWHHVACVRRWKEGGGATLELWIDGARIATTDIRRRVDMRRYWDNVPHPRNPKNLGGWAWGSEVMTAWGMYFSQYEDYKGLLDEIRFWDRARSEQELREQWNHAVTGSEPGLVGWFPFDERRGTEARDRLDRSRIMKLYPRQSSMWSTESAPTVRPTAGRARQ